MTRLIESMGASRFIMLKSTHFDFVFGFQNMFRLVNCFWIFLFKFIGSFFRLPINRHLDDLDTNFDEFNKRHGNGHVVDQGNRDGESSAMAASSSKYSFLYGKSISGFIEEPKTKSFTVHELYTGSNDTAYFNGGILDSWDSVGADYGKIEVEMGDVFEDKTEECALRFSFEKIFDFEKHNKTIQEEQPVQDYVRNSLVERAIEQLQAEQDIKDVVREKTEESDENFIAEIEAEDQVEETAESVENCITEKILEKQAGNLEGNQHVAEKQTQYEEDLSIETESMVSSDKTKGQNMQEDEEDSDFVPEHDDDLIERLNMEVKIVRTGGLPTILEDFESPKMMLGPLQIDERYDHKDHIAEIQKVYKSYSDKMRKFDILNSQTMHAISLLQLKGVPIQLSTPAKSSAPTIKSLHKALSFRQRQAEADPRKKLIRDLHKDFETVYVGQICLSWAILHWQFGQVKKLDCDTLGVHQNNQVYGEFQHFQVRLQRFLEDEQFRTRSRVENYVNYRCSVRNLLQVPVIKDDCSKYKEDAVSSEVLKDIIEESMHVFLQFIRADKDEPNSTSKAPFQLQVAPPDPINFDLLMDVRADLQRRRKDLRKFREARTV